MSLACLRSTTIVFRIRVFKLLAPKAGEMGAAMAMDDAASPARVWLADLLWEDFDRSSPCFCWVSSVLRWTTRVDFNEILKFVGCLTPSKCCQDVFTQQLIN